MTNAVGRLVRIHWHVEHLAAQQTAIGRGRCERGVVYEFLFLLRLILVVFDQMLRIEQRLALLLSATSSFLALLVRQRHLLLLQLVLQSTKLGVQPANVLVDHLVGLHGQLYLVLGQFARLCEPVLDLRVAFVLLHRIIAADLKQKAFRFLVDVAYYLCWTENEEGREGE